MRMGKTAGQPENIMCLTTAGGIKTVVNSLYTTHHTAHRQSQQVDVDTVEHLAAKD